MATAVSAPPVPPDAVDVLIIGAGSAGAAAAARLAAAGRSVLVVDARPLHRAGAYWVNGVALAQLKAAGVAPPEGEERAGGTEAMHLFAGRARLCVDDHDVAGVRMDRFVVRLQAEANRAGAILAGGARVVGLHLRNRAPVRVSIAYGGGQGRPPMGHIVEADLVVDASGLRGVARRLVPEIGLLCPPPAPDAFCAAAQASVTVADPDGAARFRNRMGVGEDEILCRLAAAGGYSVENVRLGTRRVEILTGSIPALGFTPGRRLLHDVIRRLPFLGEAEHVGARPIPLRRPYDVLAFGRVVLLGDAACQVFAGHGSGVGVGLLSARLLAEAVIESGDADEAAAWRYAHRFHTTLGPLLSASAAFSRFTARLPSDAVETLLAAGLLTRSLARNGLCQRTGLPPPDEWPDLALGALRHPRLSRTLVREVGRMTRLARQHARYPETPDAGTLRIWSHQVAALADERPDVP